MHHSNPKVFVIAETKQSSAGSLAYLHEIGAVTNALNPPADDFITNAKSGGEWVIEIAGRSCYRSFKPQLNKNVNRVREGNMEYIGNILAQKHGSVLEHAYVTFACTDVSRIFTHELVRHRAGVAISQESGRYVRIDDIGMFIPTCYSPEWLVKNVAPYMSNGGSGYDFEAVSQTLIIETDVVAITAESKMREWTARLGLDNPKMPFHVKKELTSALRRNAPSGLSTSIIFTANHRAIRHMIAMRTAEGAEEEIRQVFGDYENDAEMRKVFLDVASQMKRMYTALYQDMTIHNNGVCTFTNEKV